MKPNFALSLSSESITVLHRAAGGWREVGVVPFTADDLAGELAALREVADRLEPTGVRSKLIIPEDQIKYLTLDTMGMSDAARRKAAEVALQGATPYEVSDLSFDICNDGAKTHIAAVALETLAEAESFAVEHNFQPVSFVAVPDGDSPYLGEPFFGTAKAAADLLEQDETVEPDGIAVVVIGTIAEAAPAPDAEPAPVTEPASPPEAETPLEPEKRPDEVLPVAATPSPAPVAAEEAKPAPTPEPIPEPAANAVETPQVDKPVVPPPSAPSVSAPVTTAAPKAPVSSPTPPTPPVISPSAGSDQDEKSAQAAAFPEPTKPKLTGTRRVWAGDNPASATGFTSRRSPSAKLPNGAPRLAVTPPKPDSSSLIHPGPAIDSDVPAPAKVGFLKRRLGPAARLTKTAAEPKASPAKVEAERMTVFGSRSDQIGGKPRYLGLIMMFVLLAFLAGVAAWAAVFLDDGIAGLLRNNESRTAASAPENQITPEIIRGPDGETASTDPEAVQIAALDPVLSAEDAAVLDSLQDARTEPDLPVITPQEAAARYAVTGIWPLAPTTPLTEPETPIEPVYFSSLDPVSAATDAIALPATSNFSTDVQMAAMVSPPPFGQRTDINAAGLIVPTPEGVVAPGGYTLVAASPPLKPSASALRSTALSQETAAAIAVVSPLLGFRPNSRPTDLAERTERAQLGGISRIELAAFRPSFRPNSLQDRARQAQERAAAEIAARESETAAAATAAAAAAAALALPDTNAVAPPVQNATRLATAESKRPDTRPRNFSRIVKRAERAAPVEETRVAAAASVAPRTVTPDIPSRTSVARSATTKNAINLRRVNLIGVYGKPSSRRALVRLSNGRYQKVSVGDRIDGGRISAIGNAELRYSKNGKNVVLKIP
ncbi:hypothetical protein GGR95_001232 [Sulfitobacter undariae]|uniref:Type IV pilus biogenesis protein PilP n=1 Tax=Sulfitobacter undariae TaxID=1563671 RepID=A0A7W6GZ67_9RHOB|nr:hypothetical protein [Sulfitobacter undariae]MBB3993601.1 hypothetical protein [Sulfitobacter undariae]